MDYSWLTIPNETDADLMAEDLERYGEIGDTDVMDIDDDAKIPPPMYTDAKIVNMENKLQEQYILIRRLRLQQEVIQNGVMNLCSRKIYDKVNLFHERMFMQQRVSMTLKNYNKTMAIEEEARKKEIGRIINHRDRELKILDDQLKRIAIAVLYFF